MVSPVVDVSPVLAKGPEPDVLYGLVASCVSAVASAALGGSDLDPARGLVEDAGEARGFDKGLDEDGGGVVELDPVFGQLLAHEAEDEGLVQGRGGEGDEPNEDWLVPY